MQVVEISDQPTDNMYLYSDIDLKSIYRMVKKKEDDERMSRDEARKAKEEASNMIQENNPKYKTGVEREEEANNQQMLKYMKYRPVGFVRSDVGS